MAVLCLVANPLTSSALQRPAFLQAVQNGALYPEIRGNPSQEGQSQGAILELSVKNNTPDTVETVVERGTVLRSRDPQSQNLVVSQDLPISIGPNGYLDPPLMVFCINIDRKAPRKTDEYWPMSKATGPLMQVLDYIDRRGLQEDSSAQLAVWAITDGITARSALTRDFAAAHAVADPAKFATIAESAQRILQESGVNLAFHRPGTDYRREAIRIWQRGRPAIPGRQLRPQGPDDSIGVGMGVVLALEILLIVAVAIALVLYRVMRR